MTEFPGCFSREDFGCTLSLIYLTRLKSGEKVTARFSLIRRGREGIRDFKNHADAQNTEKTL